VSVPALHYSGCDTCAVDAVSWRLAGSEGRPTKR